MFIIQKIPLPHKLTNFKIQNQHGLTLFLIQNQHGLTIFLIKNPHKQPIKNANIKYITKKLLKFFVLLYDKADSSYKYSFRNMPQF